MNFIFYFNRAVNTNLNDIHLSYTSLLYKFVNNCKQTHCLIMNVVKHEASITQNSNLIRKFIILINQSKF